MSQRALVSSRAALHMVAQQVGRLRKMFPNADADELTALGYEALVLAAPNFDPRRGVRFATFAAKRVFGHCLRALHNEALQRWPGLEAVLNRDALQTTHEGLTSAECLTREESWARQQALAHVLAVVLHAEPPPSPAAQLQRTRVRQALRRALASLPQQHAEVITRHYADGITLAELARRRSVHRDVVLRQHAIALDRLRVALLRFVRSLDD